MDFWDTKLFQIFPFYNVLIEKPKIKHLSNVELLHELSFYDELSVVKQFCCINTKLTAIKNIHQFILILQLKQRLILNIVLTNLFKRFYTE